MIESLVARADRSLADSLVDSVSLESRFLLAYNAAVTLATAALHAAGYRTSSNVPGHHAVTIASLQLTIGAESPVVRALDIWRKKRNQASYGAQAAVSEHELRELQELTQGLKARLMTSLQKNHPHLAP